MSAANRPPVVRAIGETVVRILSVQVDLILNNPNHAPHSFSDVAEDLDRVRTICGDLRVCDLALLGIGALEQISTALPPFLNQMLAMTAFSGSATNSSVRRDELREAVGQAAETVANIVIPWLGYLAARDRSLVASAGNQLNEELKTFQSNTFQVRNDAAGAAARAKAFELEAEGALESIRAVSAAVGAAAHATTFEGEANAHDRAADIWLAVTSAATVLAFTALFWVLLRKEIPGEATNGVIAQYIILRAVLVLFLSYVPFWCSRNYRAQRHLHVVNKHRQTALVTFQTFVASTKDETTRNAVLLEATRCIFGPSQTGYLGGEEAAPADRILEIVKMVSGKND